MAEIRSCTVLRDAVRGSGSGGRGAGVVPPDWRDIEWLESKSAGICVGFCISRVVDARVVLSWPGRSHGWTEVSNVLRKGGFFFRLVLEGLLLWKIDIEFIFLAFAFNTVVKTASSVFSFITNNAQL